MRVPEGASPFHGEFVRCLEEAVHRVEGARTPDIIRMQLLDLMRRATRIRLDDHLVGGLRDVFGAAPNTIERNLDLVRLPHQPATWIELDDNARRTGEVDRTRRAAVGYLLAPHAADPDVVVVAIARQVPERADGTCHLMPALCAVNLPVLAYMAEGARRAWSALSHESLARMVMGIITYVPPGIMAELQAFGKVVPDFDLERTVMDARTESAEEAVFLFGIMVALASRNVVLEDVSEDVRADFVEPAPSLSGRLRRMFGRGPSGFVRARGGDVALYGVGDGARV